MKTLLFVVLGYGVPRDITTDNHYHNYLNTVFNRIFDIVTNNKQFTTIGIVFSGGPTDCFKPYRRTEAREMERYFKQLCQRPTVKKIARHWRLYMENEALSTLENLLFTKKFLQKKKLTPNRTIIFCEQLRSMRVFTLAQKIFGPAPAAIAMPIDFDTSDRRYETDETMRREHFVEQHDLWALSDPRNLKAYHEHYQEKIDFLRKQPAAKRGVAGKQWWEEKLKTLPQAKEQK